MSPKELFLSWGMILIGVVMNVLGMFLVKMKMNDLGVVEVGSFRLMADYFLALARSSLAICGVLLFAIASFPLAIAVSRIDIAVAYPLSVALSCIIVVPLGIVFLGEILSVTKIMAIIMVMVSIYLFYK